MLFDLRGKRKRLIQVTYVILAVLFGASLVFFGTGSGVSGGLFDALSLDGGGNGDNPFQQQVDDARERVERNPRSPAAQADLVRAELNLAASEEGSDPETGTLTQEGRQAVTEAAAAWERYLKLEPKQIDASAAGFAALAYGSLQEYDDAVKTQQIVVDRQPGANAYFQLADFAWRAGDDEVAEAAARRAIALSPKDQRNTVKDTIGRVEKQAKRIAREVKRARAEASKQARQQGSETPGTQFGPIPGQGAGATP